MRRQGEEGVVAKEEAVMVLEGFPREVTLKDGSKVIVRPLEPRDGPALQKFFRELPEEDRQYLRDDVTKDEWIGNYLAKVDHDTMESVVAERDGVILGNASLYRTHHGWTKHVAQIRVAVARSAQRHGLGTALARVLVRHAIGLGLEKMVAQVVDNQVGARRAFEKLGFKEEAVMKAHVKDIFGHKRDLIVLSNDVSYLWESMRAMVADFSPTLGG
jgi:RimJ/RimL family protein N-acetyltransferase